MLIDTHSSAQYADTYRIEAARYILTRAAYRLCAINGTFSAVELFHINEEDYAAVRILEALLDLVIWA